MTELNPQEMTLAGLIHRCMQETEHFFHHRDHDPRYCFELFRRAFVECNQLAWEYIYRQYGPVVAGWARRHPAFPDTGEEAQSFVNGAFAKMWKAMTPKKFARFKDVKSLLGYLQTCVHSVIFDHIRQVQRRDRAVQAGLWPNPEGDGNPAVEEQAMNGVRRQEIWQAISVRLRNEKERQVLYCIFVWALRPREIYALHRKLFKDVQEVYRVKENVLARLRRDDDLKKLLDQDA